MRPSILQEQPIAAYTEIEDQLDASDNEGVDDQRELGSGNLLRDPSLGYVWSVSRLGPSNNERFDDQEEVGSGNVLRDPLLGYVWSVPRSAIAGEVMEPEEEVIPPIDDRRPVVDTTAVPYRWICHLALDFGPDPAHPNNNIHARGSGTLISDRHVLTAGHNIISPRFGQVQGIRVTPGHNCAASRAAPLGFTTAASWQTHPQWQAARNFQFDFGLLTLRSAIGRQRQPALGNQPLGFWGSTDLGEGTRINPRTPADLNRRRAYISGYPGDKCCFRRFDPTTQHCRVNSWAGAQFRSSGHITNPSPASAPRLILYDLDTYFGHSGSPVWLRWDRFRNLVAVHTGPGSAVPSEPPHVSNRGVRVTADLLAQVRDWMR